jgi:hypothetical protein
MSVTTLQAFLKAEDLGGQQLARLPARLDEDF